MQEKAMQIFGQGMQWSQAVLAVGQEKLGIQDENLIKAMDSFGGGLAAHGEVCGAVIGGLAVIGLNFGRPKSGNDPDRRIWKHSSIFINRFKEEVTGGKLLCREIAGVNWRDKDQTTDYYKGEKFRSCQQLSGKTARIVGELLEQ
jgi:C_GCAxxG_C_C family probable redox protein